MKEEIKKWMNKIKKWQKMVYVSSISMANVLKHSVLTPTMIAKLKDAQSLFKILIVNMEINAISLIELILTAKIK